MRIQEKAKLGDYLIADDLAGIVGLVWEELRNSLDPASFTVETLPARLRRLAADPWKAYWTARQRLTRQLLRAVAQP